MQTELFNFNIPTELKDQFRSICTSRYRKMTDQLIELIYTFVNSHQPKSNIPDQRPQIEQWGDLVKDPATDTWIARSEYFSNVK